MTYTINDILASQFAGRVSSMTADIPSDSTEEQISDHLSSSVFGVDVPTASEVLAAVPAHLALLNKVPVPASVSPRQIRMALTRINMRLAVETAVAAGDQDIKDWWEFSTVVERNNAQVTAMGSALGLTEQQIDDLWILANSL